MKRIYATLGFLSALAIGTSSYGQALNVDLRTDIQANPNLSLNCNDKLDTSSTSPLYCIYGIINDGPDDLMPGDDITFHSSRHDFEFTANGDSIRYWYSTSSLQNVVPANTVATAYSFDRADDLMALLNLDSVGTGASFWRSMVNQKDLTVGETYGFWVRAFGVGSDPNSPINNDVNPDNNFSYVPVVWNCGNPVPTNPNDPTDPTDPTDPSDPSTGIYDMMLEAAHSVNIFPNPAQSVLNFKYGFIQTTEKATARVIDMAGRTLITKELGKQTFGTPTFNMDISNLPAGNYILQVSTDYMNGVGKFTVTK